VGSWTDNDSIMDETQQRPPEQEPQKDIHSRWIQHQKKNAKTTSTYACIYCQDRRIFTTPTELLSHAEDAHPDKFPLDEAERQAVKLKYEEESAMKRSAAPPEGYSALSQFGPTR